MRNCILIDSLPDTVWVGGIAYGIRADFRTALRFEILIRDKAIPDQVKLEQMLQMFYPVIPEDIQAALEAILWFYHGGKEAFQEENTSDKRQEGQKGGRKKKSRTCYSFSQDAPYIYASFLEQYGINLQRIRSQELHWWEFLALFESLGEHTRMGRILYYRTVSTAGMSKEKRHHVNEMKKLYALRKEVDCDKKAALVRRNTDWKDYVKRRMEQKTLCCKGR